MTIPKADIAKALAGQRYRVRWGTLQLPGPDDPVDALTGAYGFRAEGPFEQEIEVVADDVHVSVFPGEIGSGPAHRLLGCVDIRPAHVRGVTTPGVVVLDVQPVGDAPATPLIIDAVTGERLPIDGSQVLDENNMPCDNRLRARVAWDDNVRRLHRSTSR